MQKYVAFLRGINMAGHNSMKMTDLSDLFKGLGYRDAEIYIQSGNIVFSISSDSSLTETARIIEKAILEKFRYNIPALIRTVNELKDLYLKNPFLKEENFDPARMAVLFLYENTTEAQIKKVIDIDYPPDKFRVSGKEIFIYCPNGFGKTKLYTNFFEKKMGVIGTARNWKTVATILTIAEKK